MIGVVLVPISRPRRGMHGLIRYGGLQVPSTRAGPRNSMKPLSPIREALKKLTRERVPRQWAISSGRGVALMLLIRCHGRCIDGKYRRVGLALTFASLPAAAQQWTPKQRAACEPDAMRLCNQYIPDVQRVSACMSAYRRYLSPACRAFYGGHRKKVRRR